jgi:hypothetical protein
VKPRPTQGNRSMATAAPEQHGAEYSAFGSVAAIRLTKAVLNGPTVLTSVRSPKSAGPIVSAVAPIAVTLPSIPVPVSVAGAVVVIAISGSRVISEIKIDALR